MITAFYVTASPNITYITPTTTVTLHKNHTAILRCAATGYPLPTIVWEPTIGGHYQITSEKINDMTWSEVIISNITLSQRGNYTCYAKNSEGADKDTVKFIVNGEL